MGRQRGNNEDYFGLADELGFYVVCDGMGGHASGEVASQMMVENTIQFMRENWNKPCKELPYRHTPGSQNDRESLLSNAIQYGNERVYIAGMKDSKLEGMGTTIVAVLATDDAIILGHVGDSRIYCHRGDGSFAQVTRDHSLLNYKLDRGELQTEAELKNFKQGNVIVRAIGLKDAVEPEINRFPRRPGDIYLLCSDGLSDLVEEWLMDNVFVANRDDLEEAAQCFIRMANNAGGKDNITVLLVRVDDSAAVQEATAPAAVPVHAAGTGQEITDPRGMPAPPADGDERPADVEVRLPYETEPDEGAEDSGERTSPGGLPAFDEADLQAFQLEETLRDPGAPARPTRPADDPALYGARTVPAAKRVPAPLWANAPIKPAAPPPEPQDAEKKTGGRRAAPPPTLQLSGAVEIAKQDAKPRPEEPVPVKPPPPTKPLPKIVVQVASGTNQVEPKPKPKADLPSIIIDDSLAD
jgi:protein phosphatase